MKLFYHPNIEGQKEFVVEEEEAKHLRVLRIGEVDDIYFTDGRGLLALCRIILDKKQTHVRVVEITRHQPATPSLTVMVAPTKNSDRMEWFVEKAVELGIHKIIFAFTANSERPYLKPERIKRVAISAMKQSLKYYLPEIEIAGQFLKDDKPEFSGAKLIAHCNDTFDRKNLFDQLQNNTDTLIAIGPEGDFNAEEITKAQNLGYRGISMGENRLRTETAALYAVMAFNLKNQA